MPSLGNIFPAANGASFGNGEAAALPVAPNEDSESFDQVMSRALSPHQTAVSATPSRQSINPAGAQKKHFADARLAMASANSAKDSPAATTDSSAPVKTKVGAKPDDAGSKAADATVPTEKIAASDGSQNTPILLLAPALAACLLKSLAPAASPSVAKNPEVAVATVPVVDATVAPTVAEAVSQLAAGGLPKPLSAKSAAARTTSPEKADPKTASVSAVVPKISGLAEATDSAPKKVEAVSVDDFPPSNADEAVVLQNPPVEPASFAPAKSHGTSVAKQDLPMKNAEQTNKVAGPAGSAEKVLPGELVRAGSDNNLPERAGSIPISARVEPPEANVITVAAAPASPVRGTGPADDAVVVANISDVRSQALDRTHDLVMLHALRLVGADSDSLQVVIKPDAGTQLSLELRQRGGGIEAQAVLQSGDFEKLKQHWPELQQRLEQRGIKLAPLASTENQTSWSGSQGFKQPPDQPAERESFLTGAFAGFVPAGAMTSLPAAPAGQAAPSRGWQTWA